MTASIFLEAFGQFAIAFVLIILGLLSKRLGTATRAKPKYIGFYFAAGFLLIGVVLRLANGFLHWFPDDTLQFSLEGVLVYNGLPAVGITLGVIFSWRYWSWLLAERD
ncbi:MAG: hypothetical protein U0670_10270 [Anaerolineae bacterium]